MEHNRDIIIKKATMIRKNIHNINEVYTFEKGVRNRIIILLMKRVI